MAETTVPPTLPETKISHLKIGRAPIGNDRIPTHFQVRHVSFRKGNRLHSQISSIK